MNTIIHGNVFVLCFVCNQNFFPQNLNLYVFRKTSLTSLDEPTLWACYMHILYSTTEALTFSWPFWGSNPWTIHPIVSKATLKKVLKISLLEWHFLSTLHGWISQPPCCHHESCSRESRSAKTNTINLWRVDSIKSCVRERVGRPARVIFSEVGWV